MFCLHCGNKLEDGDQFCGVCGSKVNWKEVPQQEQKVNNEVPQQLKSAEPKPTKTAKNPKKKSAIIITAIVTLLIVISLGGAFYVNYQSKEKVIAKLKAQTEEAPDYFANYMLGDYETDYNNLLSDSIWAVDHKEVKKAKEYIISWEELKKSVEDSNTTEIESLINNLSKEDTSMAYEDELDKIETFKTDIAKYTSDKDYVKAKDVTKEWKELIEQMHIPAEILSLTAYQVDTSEFPLIRLYIDAKNQNGDTPTNLKKEVFELTEMVNSGSSYEKQEILNLEQLNENAKLNIDMVADVSGSMDGYPLEQAQTVMQDFIDNVQFNIGDKVELTVFSDGVEVYQEFTDDKDSISNQIDQLVTMDRTSLYDALYAAVNRTALQSGAKCVIAFTDGMDNYSSCSVEDVIDVANRYRIPIYIIGVGEELDNYNLTRLTEETSGFYTNIDDFNSMSEIYEEIYREQKELYMLEYTTKSSKSTMDEHDVKISINSREWSGKCEYSYTPNILQNVDNTGLTSGDDIDNAVSNYLHGFVGAINDHDFSYLEPYLVDGSPIAKEQEKYIVKDINEQLQSYEITDKIMKDDETCIVTVRETYGIDKPQEALHMLVQEGKYVLKKQADGSWKFYAFADSIKVLQKLNY